jgi:hypothetical protein
MQDSRSIHVGITGRAAVVGKGLGAYKGNKGERAAVARGLARYYAGTPAETEVATAPARDAGRPTATADIGRPTLAPEASPEETNPLTLAFGRVPVDISGLPTSAQVDDRRGAPAYDGPQYNPNQELSFPTTPEIEAHYKAQSWLDREVMERNQQEYGNSVVGRELGLDLVGVPTAPVAPPASAPLGWTSSPGDRGKDAVTTPESSRTGTTDPALVGPARGTADRGVQTQYAKAITTAALKGVGPNTSKDEAIAKGKAAQAEMARAGVPASVARAALMDLAVQIATRMGYGPGSLSWSTGMVESGINSGVNSGMQGYQGAPPGPVQGPPSPAAAPAPAIEAAPAAPVPAAPAPAAPTLEAAISLAQQLGLDDITSSPSLGPNNFSALDPAPGMVDPSNANNPGLPSIDPGGLQYAEPGLFGPVEAAPIDLPTITNEETAPVDYGGPFQSPLTSENESPLTSENEAPGLFAALGGTQGDSLEGFVRLLAEGLSMQAGMPADEAMQMVLAAAHRLIEEQGLSTERALQVVAQSMQTQMAA